MTVTDNDFGDLINRATRLWRENFGDLLLLSLVFVLVGWIPLANVGFLAGYVRAILTVARGGKAKIGDLFSAWDCFGDLLLYLLALFFAHFVLAHLPVIGQVASFLLMVVTAPGLYGIIDRRMKFMAAFRWSLQVVRADFFDWLLAMLIGSIFAAAGALLLGIGIILTLGWGSLIMAMQYDKGEPPRVIHL